MTVLQPATALSTLTQRASHCYNMVDEQRDVFESHRHHIFSVAYYMTGDEREAETILQSSFVEAFERQARPSIEDLDRALMRELHRRLSFAQVESALGSMDASAGLGGRNVRRTDLEEALWQLPSAERLCFLLRDVEGYPAPRVAGLLHTSEMEVQRTLFSARVRMRNLLIQARAGDRSDA